ncbi:hypothetical protein D3C74_236620 [compost metagenome]
MNRGRSKWAKSNDEHADNAKMKKIPKDAWIVGPEYDFWLNDKDDVYDELYKNV